jgi:hypothetical protein
VQDARTVQDQHHLVIRVAVVGRPAWRDLAHELSRRTSFARRTSSADRISASPTAGPR